MFDLRVNNYQQTILTIAQDFNHIRNFRTLYIDRENCPLYNSRKFNPNFFYFCSISQRMELKDGNFLLNPQVEFYFFCHCIIISQKINKKIIVIYV